MRAPGVGAASLLLYALAPLSDASAQDAHIRELLCGDQGNIEGVIAGSAVDAATSQPMKGAKLSARWLEMSVAKGKLVSAPAERSAITDSAGMFRLCSLPAEGNVRLSVNMPGFPTIEGDVALDPELWVRALRLNNHVPAKDVLAVEAYPDVISAPFVWRTNDACAVIVFWTKHAQ